MRGVPGIHDIYICSSKLLVDHFPASPLFFNYNTSEYVDRRGGKEERG